MDPEHHARALATATVVLAAMQTGTPLSIPGTREMGVRVTRPVAAATDNPAAIAVDARMPTVRVEQRDHERSGGGAPSERDTTRGASVFEWLRRFLR